MQYNKNKHLTLLKDSTKLKGPKTSFSDEEFLKLLESRPDENCFELEVYLAMLISHLHLENREQYFELIAKLLNGPINFLEPNPKYGGFVDLIDQLVSIFGRY
jgi:hypothetical protein